MVVYLYYTKTDKNNIMKDIKTYIEKEVKLLNTQSGGGRELTHFGKGAKHAFLKVLDKIKELEAVNNIEVVEPTEIRKGFESDIQKGDIVEFTTNETFSPARKGDLCSVINVGDELVKLSYSGKKFWETKINLKKVIN